MMQGAVHAHVLGIASGIWGSCLHAQALTGLRVLLYQNQSWDILRSSGLFWWSSPPLGHPFLKQRCSNRVLKAQLCNHCTVSLPEHTWIE